MPIHIEFIFMNGLKKGKAMVHLWALLFFFFSPVDLLIPSSCHRFCSFPVFVVIKSRACVSWVVFLQSKQCTTAKAIPSGSCYLCPQTGYQGLAHCLPSQATSLNFWAVVKSLQTESMACRKCPHSGPSGVATVRHPSGPSLCCWPEDLPGWE